MAEIDSKSGKNTGGTDTTPRQDTAHDDTLPFLVPLEERPGPIPSFRRTSAGTEIRPRVVTFD